MSTVSLVTGGNRGIGREVCRQLAERGHTVVLTARSADAAATAARAAGAGPLQLDVADPASIAAAARQVGERHGRCARSFKVRMAASLAVRMCGSGEGPAGVSRRGLGVRGGVVVVSLP